MFPPFPPQDDLAEQVIRLITDIISLQKPPSFVAIFFTLLGLEQKFGILRRFIAIIGKAKTKQLPVAEPAKTSGNGNGHTNGNGNAKEPIILALISSEKEYLLSQIEHDRTRNREDKQRIRENVDGLSVRLAYVERDVGIIQTTIRDHIAPMRTQLDAIQHYIESQNPKPDSEEAA